MSIEFKKTGSQVGDILPMREYLIKKHGISGGEAVRAQMSIMGSDLNPYKIEDLWAYSSEERARLDPIIRAERDIYCAAKK